MAIRNVYLRHGFSIYLFIWALFRPTVVCLEGGFGLPPGWCPSDDLRKFCIQTLHGTRGTPLPDCWVSLWTTKESNRGHH